MTTESLPELSPSTWESVIQQVETGEYPEPLRRAFFAAELQQLSAYERELILYNSASYENEDGSLKGPRQLTTEQQMMIGGTEGMVRDAVVYEGGVCRYIGKEYFRKPMPPKDFLNAREKFAKLCVAEAAKLIKKETKPERAARIAAELDEMGLKAVPK